MWASIKGGVAPVTCHILTYVVYGRVYLSCGQRSQYNEVVNVGVSDSVGVTSPRVWYGIKPHLAETSRATGQQQSGDRMTDCEWRDKET
jgi:hypothetical protein